MKKLISLALMATLALSVVSCGGSDSSQSDSLDSSAEDSSVQTSLEQTEAAHKETDNMFNEYFSNTVVSTGNNARINKAESVTYRAYFPVEEYGELEYCFYFSNEIDSTYSNGSPVHVGAETGDYTIESARIADGGTSTDDEITNYVDVTFDGSASREVSSGEQFWSDPVNFSLEEGHYLVWEWTITGSKIPATNMSDLTSTTSSDDGEEFVYCAEPALPQLIGAKREVKLSIAAIGDSITQGCMTDYMAYESWAMQISQKLGEDYSFWNCGLGWARASDAAYDGDWLERVTTADVVIIAFGTNDIGSGEYGGDGGNSADEIDAYVRTLIEKCTAAGCSVVVFNSPPQDYEGDYETVRTEYNEMLESTCSELGVYCFDFASLLCDEDAPSVAKYGGHPNGEAGGIVSDAFIEEYSVLLGLE